MDEWVYIPAHRVLKITFREFHDGFRKYNEGGEPAKPGETTYRFERIADNKLFRAPTYHGAYDADHDLVYLEEVLDKQDSQRLLGRSGLLVEGERFYERI